MAMRSLPRCRAGFDLASIVAYGERYESGS